MKRYSIDYIVLLYYNKRKNIFLGGLVMINFYLVLNFNCKNHLVKVDQIEFESTISFYSESVEVRKRNKYYREGEITVIFEIKN